MSKADDYNLAQLADGKLTPTHVSELVRFWQAGHRLTEDCMAGPATIATLNAWIAMQEPTGPEERPA